MAESEEDFGDEMAAAILRADAQCDAGEGRDLADVAALLAIIAKSREQFERGEALDFRQALLELRGKYE